LEKLFANFLWKGKIHACSWTDLCKPKEEGGDIRRIQDINKAARMKLNWKLCISKSLWVEWIKERYLRFYPFWKLVLLSLILALENS